MRSTPKFTLSVLIFLIASTVGLSSRVHWLFTPKSVDMAPPFSLAFPGVITMTVSKVDTSGLRNGYSVYRVLNPYSVTLKVTFSWGRHRQDYLDTKTSEQRYEEYFRFDTLSNHHDEEYHPVYKDTAYFPWGLPVFVYRYRVFKNRADSVWPGGRPYIRAITDERGYGYTIKVSPRSKEPVRDTAKVWQAMDWALALVLLNTRDLPEEPDIFNLMDTDYYEDIREIIHSRPFWIEYADTVGPCNFCSGVHEKYLAHCPAFVIGYLQGYPEKGLAAYEANCMTDRSDPVFLNPGYGSNYGPGGTHVWIAWCPVDDTTGYQPTLEFETSLEDSIFPSTFMGYSALFVLHDRRSRNYTHVLFRRKGIEYRVTAEGRDSFLLKDPACPWRTWFEEHWQWADEPHPDYSRYPVAIDSVRKYIFGVNFDSLRSLQGN